MFLHITEGGVIPALFIRSTMLTFTKIDGDYLVTEHIMGWAKTWTTTVRYKPDLSEKQINKEPWQECDQRSKDWFNENYRKHYEKENQTNEQ